MRHRFYGPAALLVFSALLAFDVWLLFVKPSGSWQDGAGLWFAVVGLFALATGFVSATELRKALPGDLDNMTSPWPGKFLRGNGVLVGLSTSFAVALLYGQPPWTTRRLERLRDTWLWPVHVVVLILASLLKMVAALLFAGLAFAAIAAYLVLVMPAAYPAYAAAGFSLGAIAESEVPEDLVVHRDVNPREIVRDHEVPLRAFAVGALGTISGFLLRVISLY